MRTKTSVAISLLCVAWATAGPLDPPSGPVGQTGRFGPRIEINQTNTPGDAGALFLIDQPGSYFLPGNVMGESGKNGIEIVTSGVTIDLMGHVLRGVPGSLDGIGGPQTELLNLTVRNGIIDSWGDAGMDLRTGVGVLIENVHASRNESFGIYMGTNCIIRACTATSNGSLGLRVGTVGVIESSVSHLNGSSGISAFTASVVRACASSENTGAGIGASGGVLITGCASYQNAMDGISTGFACTVVGNMVYLNEDDGIDVNAGSLVRDNNIRDNTGAGVRVRGAGSRVDANNADTNGVGVLVEAAGNMVVRNTASSNTTNFDIAADNIAGPVIDPTAVSAPAILGNSGNGSVGSLSPWVNIAQ